MNNILIKTFNSYFDNDYQYDEITVLANSSAIIYQLFPNINWVGFYLFKNNVLQLGPFQGKPACMIINLDNGVCGFCARTKKSIIVDNVHQFDGHIACDSSSNSELVIPIIFNDSLYGVLDIDSTEFSRFKQSDLELMEHIVQIIISKISK